MTKNGRISMIKEPMTRPSLTVLHGISAVSASGDTKGIASVVKEANLIPKEEDNSFNPALPSTPSSISAVT